MKRQIVAVAVAILLSFSGRHAWGEILYGVTDLGTLGSAPSVAYGINDRGQIVGVSHTPSGVSSAFLYSGSTMTDLGTGGEAYDINNRGAIVGRTYVSGGNLRGFLYRGSTITVLGTLGGSFSDAKDLNEAEQVVGEATTTTGLRHAFLYSGGVMTDLGTLGGIFSQAIAINNYGDVVGTSEKTWGYPYTRAFLYSGGAMTELEILEGHLYCAAHDINDRGQIVGQSSSSDVGHAVLWASSGLIDLGTLGGPQSIARGINNRGQIVGGAQTSDGANHAFLSSYNDPTMTESPPMLDLCTVIDPSSGWTLVEARDINDSGQIVGYGTIHGETHAFLLTPVPEPSTLMLLGVGTLGFAYVRQRRKRTA